MGFCCILIFFFSITPYVRTSSIIQAHSCASAVPSLHGSEVKVIGTLLA